MLHPSRLPLIAGALTLAALTAAAQDLTSTDTAAQARAETQRRIRQAVSAGTPAAALEVYAGHVALTKKHDVELLQDVARALLVQVGDDQATPARVPALERLAASGSASVRQGLRQMAAAENALEPAGLAADAALGRLGDEGAIDRLIARLGDEGLRDKAGALEALVAANVRRAAYAAAALLQDGSPFNRMAAARALAVIGSREHIEPLRAALESETQSPIKPSYAVALKSLGSSAADTLFASLESSPVPDVQVQAMDAYYWAKIPQWKTLARALLRSTSEGARLRAAELLGLEDAEAKGEILRAATSTNVALREIGSRLLEATGSRDLDLLVKLLRDSSPVVRTHAAGAIMAAARR